MKNTWSDVQLHRKCEELREINGVLLVALKAYHEHFGILEDNCLLHEDARKCSRLAKAAITKAEKLK